MTVPVPTLHAPNMVDQGGRLSPALITFLKALGTGVDAATTEADLADLEAQVAALAAAATAQDLLNAMYGTHGIQVLGSIESGVEIRGSDGNDLLAGQIFGA